MKICTKCGTKKELTEFNKKASKKDGYSNYCRKCANTPVIINPNGKRICNTCHKEKELILFKKKKTFAFKCNDCFTQEDAKKVCNKCNLEKDINSFEIRKDNGKYRNECRECKQLTTNKWKNSNLEYLLIKRKEYAKSEKKKISDKKYYEKKKLNKPKKIKQTKEERKEKQRLYYLNNKERLQEKNYEWHKQKLETDPSFKLKKSIRTMLYLSFKRNGYTKNSRSFMIIGCDFEELKIYIENKFEHWMSWENYGKYNGELNYGWDIDHIIPLETAKIEEDIIKLNHFTNLQPLCSKVNRDIKRDYYEQEKTY